MSSYETHKGKIKKVDCHFDEPRYFLSKHLVDFDYEGLSLMDVIYELDLQDKYIALDDTLYEWIEHTVKYDEEDDFCDLTENADGTISVHAQFYNGGTCIDEMIENNVPRIKKYENKELSTDEMINVACKWLDYHHSNYATKLEGKYIVEGRCQTDLRYFLENAKQ